MKAKIIGASLLAAVAIFIIAAAGIEGMAPIPACVAVMAGCLVWMGLVIYANR